MTWNNWKSFIFRWRSRCGRRCPCLNLLKLSFGHFLNSIHVLNLPCNSFFQCAFWVEVCWQMNWENYCVARELRLYIHWPMIHRVNGSIGASYTAKDKFPFLLHSVSLYNLFENETLFTFFNVYYISRFLLMWLHFKRLMCSRESLHKYERNGIWKDTRLSLYTVCLYMSWVFSLNWSSFCPYRIASVYISGCIDF